MDKQLEQEIIKIVEEMTLMDDLLFGSVFKENIPAMNLLLRACLDDENIEVVSVRTNFKENNLAYHSVIFDAKVVGSDGNLFDVEVQRDSRGAGIKRGRFYASAMDMSALNKGEEYESIRDVSVIIICNHDYWRTGREKEEFSLCMVSEMKLIDDGRKIIYINGAAKGESQLARLIHDLNCSKPKDMYYNEIKEKVGYIKDTEEGLMEFTGSLKKVYGMGSRDGLQKGIKQGYEKGKEEGKKINSLDIASKMKAENFPIQTIESITGLSKSEIERL